MKLPRFAAPLGLAAGLLAAGLTTGAVAGGSSGGDDGPAFLELTGARTETTTNSPEPAVGGSQIATAGEAGTVTVTRTASGLEVVSVAPAAGWSPEVEQAAGREVEVTLRSGARRIDLNVELEDGVVRQRVRERATDDATTTTTAPGADDDGTPDQGPGDAPGNDDADDVNDDRSGPNPGPSHDDDADDDGDRGDNSGHGGGDDDRSGHGGGDDSDDD